AIGKAYCLKQGETVAVLSTGPIGNQVTDAIKLLDNPSHIGHYDFPFVKPLDAAMLHEIFAKYTRIITIEDGVITGGFGSAVTEFAQYSGYYKEIRMLGIADEFIGHGTVAELHRYSEIDIQSIVNHLSYQ